VLALALALALALGGLLIATTLGSGAFPPFSLVNAVVRGVMGFSPPNVVVFGVLGRLRKTVLLSISNSLSLPPPT
jgi:hypothetical protein